MFTRAKSGTMEIGKRKPARLAKVKLKDDSKMEDLMFKKNTKQTSVKTNQTLEQLSDELFTSCLEEDYITSSLDYKKELEAYGLSIEEIAILDEAYVSDLNKNSGGSVKGVDTHLYTYYEDILLLMLKRHNDDNQAVIATFNNSPCSRRRSYSGITKRYKKLAEKLGTALYGDWKDILPLVALIEANKEIPNKEVFEETENKVPTGYVRNVDFGEVQSVHKKESIDFPLGTIISDRMHITDHLTKAQYAQRKKYYSTVHSLFSLLKRGNSPKMSRAVRVSELAYEWKCGVDEVINRIDAFISRGVPIIREDDLVRELKHEDNMCGGISLTDIKVEPVDLEDGASVIRLGVLSDTHYGSPMCQEDLIERFYEIAYDAGVRVFMHAGDLFDGEGVYKGHDFEVISKGFDKNLTHVANIYPKFPDAVTYAIVGNHDHSYISKSGANPLFHLNTLRKDIIYSGIYQANFRINNEFLVNLHHGASGCSRVAPEAYLRRIIGDKQEFLQSLGIMKYDLCVLGHYHIDATVETPFCRKGIFGGGWQGTTAFTRRLNLPTYLGGYIVNLYKLPNTEHYITVEKIAFN